MLIYSGSVCFDDDDEEEDEEKEEEEVVSFWGQTRKENIYRRVFNMFVMSSKPNKALCVLTA